MSNKWLLVETFGPAGSEPTVIGVGNSPRNFVGLRTILRGKSSSDIMAIVTAAQRGRLPIDAIYEGRRIIAKPLLTFDNTVHGVYVWSDAEGTEPPEQRPAGAWHFNLTTGTIGGSNDLLDLYGVPENERQEQRNMAEAFSRLVTNADEAAAIAKIVRGEPGMIHQATWTVRRDDGDLRAAHFSCRIISEHHDGDTQRVLRGITQDIGGAGETPSAPPPVVLAQQVLAGLAEPGTHRAIIDLNTLRLVRWMAGDEPAPGIAWALDTQDDVNHWIHPEDFGAATEVVESMVGSVGVKTVAEWRFRTTDRQWRPVPVTLHLVLLDPHTTAGLLTLDLGAAAGKRA